jgi:protein-S-isoprenylcysteine O-methyltransferase Ste14
VSNGDDVSKRAGGEAAEPQPPTRIKLALSLVAGLLLFAALVLVPAGRWDWEAGWAYLGLLGVGWPASVVYLMRVNPEVVAHRMVIKSGTEPWDKVWGGVFALLFTAVFVVPGLGVRWGWAALPPWSWPAGLALFLGGGGLLIRSMGENPFFEKTVRIQTDRAQRVVDTGPYAVVRHPGYAGLVPWILSVPLLLGSAPGLIPAALAVAAVVVRTALEDRTLRQKLPGYVDYAERVRARLIPGVW